MSEYLEIAIGKAVSIKDINSQYPASFFCKDIQFRTNEDEIIVVQQIAGRRYKIKGIADLDEIMQFFTHSTKQQ